jgi:hypothetical protein
MSQRGAIVPVLRGQPEKPRMAVFVAENGSSVVAFLTPSGLRPYYDAPPEEILVEAEPVPPVPSMRDAVSSDVREVSRAEEPPASEPPAAKEAPRTTPPAEKIRDRAWTGPQRAAVALVVFASLTAVMLVAWFASVESPWTWKSAIALLSMAFGFATAALVWREPSRVHLACGFGTMAFSLLRVGSPLAWTGVTAALVALTALLALPVVLAYMEVHARGRDAADARALRGAHTIRSARGVA